MQAPPPSTFPRGTSPVSPWKGPSGQSASKEPQSLIWMLYPCNTLHQVKNSPAVHFTEHLAGGRGAAHHCLVSPLMPGHVDLSCGSHHLAVSLWSMDSLLVHIFFCTPSWLRQTVSLRQAGLSADLSGPVRSRHQEVFVDRRVTG